MENHNVTEENRVAALDCHLLPSYFHFAGLQIYFVTLQHPFSAVCKMCSSMIAPNLSRSNCSYFGYYTVSFLIINQVFH